ncbi:MAG: hypothetical protein MJZ96_05730 [Paludibacteraceae bacterium]|nr:hypothetical protein [Paludibacteraceae bacterium]
MGANIGFAPSMGIWEIGKDVFPKICWLRERLLAFSGSQLCAKKASPPFGAFPSAEPTAWFGSAALRCESAFTPSV